MKGPQLIPCVVVYTLINSRKNYVAGGTTRFDNTYLPDYSRDVQKAKPFVDEGEAQAFIPNIHSHFQRKYFTEEAMVPKENTRIKFTEDLI